MEGVLWGEEGMETRRGWRGSGGSQDPQHLSFHPQPHATREK